MQWTAIVVTCHTNSAAVAIQEELERRQHAGLFDEKTIVLAVADPMGCVGSGGATLNALLVVAEHISANRKFSVVNADVLYDSTILILHLSRHYEYEPCGRGFLSLPVTLPNADCGSLATNMDVLVHLITTKLAVLSRPGVWVTSTDMLLHIPLETDVSSLYESDACVISVPGDVSYARQHGVYRTTEQGHVADILYQASPEQLRSCCIPDTDKVPLVSGIVYLSAHVAETMLGFHTSPPLDACTYIGADTGSTSIKMSLFFDLLLAMCSGVTKDEFVSGSRSGAFGQNTPSDDLKTRIARQEVWTALRQYKLSICFIPEGRHLYLNQQGMQCLKLMAEYRQLFSPELDNHVHIYFQKDAQVSDGVLAQNSLVEGGCRMSQGCSLTHTYLNSNITVGQNCILNNINTSNISVPLVVPDETIAMGVNIMYGDLEQTKYVQAVWGLADQLYQTGQVTICGCPLSEKLSRYGIDSSEAWDSNIPESERCLFNAKLYPVWSSQEHASLLDISWLWSRETDTEAVRKWRSNTRLSLENVLNNVDLSSQLSNHRALFHTIGLRIIQDSLLQSKYSDLNRLYAAAVCNNLSSSYLFHLDNIASSCGDAGIAARTLANIANMLGAMAGNAGGLRSGPAGNKQWAPAFSLLEREDIEGGIKALTAERANWLSRPELLVRAARHYEGAAQILIRSAVMSARQFIYTTECEPSLIGRWVEATCPARIDIAGGWSDTPPITYEHGGAVINAAITIDGERPIGCKVCRIEELVLRIRVLSCGEVVLTVNITELSQLADYTNPQAPGALLKAAFCCAEIVDLTSEKTLSQQLQQKHGGGFELHSWSNLKHGSGLGTSSILAGAIMAALWRASGRSVDTDSLIHAISHLEQMLTTGGGWQDQVGGLKGGIKVGHSEGKLPLRINTTYYNVSDETAKSFGDRLVLVYTGKTRLAKNLLQNVLRNWYARDPEIVKVIDDLVSTAWQCAKEFEKGDLAGVGACMNKYWDLKKLIAPGSEPVAVTRMMAALKPHAHGLCLAGAGGGGYMYVLMKESGGPERVKHILGTVKEATNITVHDGAVDMLGLKVTVEGQC